MKLILTILCSAVLISTSAQFAPSRLSYKDASQGTSQTGNRDVWQACPGNSIFSQIPSLPAQFWTFYSSDLFQGFTPSYLVADQFYGLTSPIGAVHFWGINAFYNYGWYYCNGEDPMTFEITFYEYALDMTGDEVYSEIISISHDYTGNDYSGYQGYHYKAVLSNPVSLTNGWISIQGISDASPENCIFVWQNSYGGNGHALQNGEVIYEDLAFCLEPADKTVIPLSPWAMALAVFLIIGMVFYRFIRLR